MNHGCHRHTKQKSLQRVAGEGAQYFLELTAGLFLQRFAHGVHAKQEHGQAAQQAKYMEYIHRALLLAFRRISPAIRDLTIQDKSAGFIKSM